MTSPEELKEIIITRLRNELPVGLFYHSPEHTLDVLQAAEHLAHKEKLNEDETRLLRVAAIFHDTGYIKGRDNHEVSSCNIAQETLPAHGYSKEMIEQVCVMIMATRIPQTPLNKLSQVLCDADLDYLGRDDYFTIAARLEKEMFYFNMIKSDADWNIRQFGFFKSHHYFTQTAKKMRDKKKAENLLVIAKEQGSN